MNMWSGKSVLVTGHTGFKGSWLSWWLSRLGAQVHGLALAPPTKPSLYEVLNLEKVLATSTIGDIRDFATVDVAVRATNAEVIFHLAAQPLVRYSYANPLETYAVNVMGTVHLLEAARQSAAVKVIVNITTDKCYENREWPWPYRENDQLGGRDPYSNSKACSELVTSAYNDSFFRNSGIAIATARAGNVIGGGDWAVDRLIPDFLRSLDQNANLVVRAPHAVRPWQHVLEPLAGYLRLAEKLSLHEPLTSNAWNFGPDVDDAKSVEWIVNFLCSQVPNSRFTIDGSPRVHEANLLRLDNSLARECLNWTPRWNLQQALRHTLDWHNAWKAGHDLRDITNEQIDAYERTE